MKHWKPAVAGLGGVLLVQAAVTGGLLHLERGEDFCVGCHLHEEKQRSMSGAAAVTGQLASRHREEGIGCPDCHRPPGPAGRVLALYTLGVRDTVRFLSGNYEEPRRLTTPLRNGLCIECHGETLARSGNIESYHGNVQHNRRQDIRCTSCHLHHVGGDPGFAYLEMGAFEAGCESCHVGLFPHAVPAQALAPATGEFSPMRRNLRAKGIEID